MPRSSRAMLRAQAHAATVLGATLGFPGASLLARRARAPRVDDFVLAGVPCDDRASEERAAVAGARLRERRHARRRANAPDGDEAQHCARADRALVVIPDLPGIAGGELSPATLARSVGSDARRVRERGEAAQGRVALAGVSVGRNSRAAHREPIPLLADRISMIACVAPYSDLARVMLLATTGTIPHRRSPSFPIPCPPYLARRPRAVARRDAAGDTCNRLPLRRASPHRPGVGGRLRRSGAGLS